MSLAPPGQLRSTPGDTTTPQNDLVRCDERAYAGPCEAVSEEELDNEDNDHDRDDETEYATDHVRSFHFGV
jgi:hypothetical protein